MSDTILVALSGSECGQRALDAAVKHAKLTRSNLIRTYVIDWSPNSFNTTEENEERHQRRESEIQRAGETVLNLHAEALKNSGLDIQTVVRHENR